MYGCIKRRYDEVSVASHRGKRDQAPPWGELVGHLSERGFCGHACTREGDLRWLHYYSEGSLTYCRECNHFGVLVRPYMEK